MAAIIRRTLAVSQDDALAAGENADDRGEHRQQQVIAELDW